VRSRGGGRPIDVQEKGAAWPKEKKKKRGIKRDKRGVRARADGAKKNLGGDA